MDNVRKPKGFFYYRKILFLSLLIFSLGFSFNFPGGGAGTTYHIGSDVTDDYASWTAMQVAVQEVAGDTVSFRRDETFREQVTVPNSGSSGSVITYTAHGSGAAPIINGADVVNTWATHGSWSTDWDPNLTFSATGETHRNMRSVYSCGTTGTKVRVTMKAGSAESGVDGTSIGLRDGVSEDYDGTPTRITWDTGSHTTTIASGASKLSDEITFSLTNGSDYFIHLYQGDTYSVAYTGPFDSYYESGADQDDTLVENIAGYSPNTVNYGVDKVEIYTEIANVWQATVTTEPVQVFFDGVRGALQASAVACTSSGDWYWDSNVLYVYHTEDPDGSGVVIEASKRSYAILINDKSYITIDGLEVTKSNSTLVSTVYTSTPAVGVTIQNCDINYGGKCGVSFGQSAGGNHLVDSNEVSYCLEYGIYGWIHTGSGSGTETVISNNEVHHNGYSGIQNRGCYWIIEYNEAYNNGLLSQVMSGITTYADVSDAAAVGDNNIIRYNVVYNQSNSGATADGCGFVIDQWCDNNQVYYNIAYNNDGTGFSFLDCQNTTIYNNVSYGNIQESNRTIKAEYLFWGSETRTEDAYMKNNIGHATSAYTYAIYVLDDVVGSSGLDITNNCWYASATNWYYWDSGGGNVLATWNALTGVGTDFNTDPLMTDPANGDFTLQPNSPCIDAGVDVGLTEDYAGNPIGREIEAIVKRIMKRIIVAPIGYPDIGAYEYYD